MVTLVDPLALKGFDLVCVWVCGDVWECIMSSATFHLGGCGLAYMMMHYEVFYSIVSAENQCLYCLHIHEIIITKRCFGSQCTSWTGEHTRQQAKRLIRVAPTGGRYRCVPSSSPSCNIMTIADTTRVQRWATLMSPTFRVKFPLRTNNTNLVVEGEAPANARRHIRHTPCANRTHHCLECTRADSSQQERIGCRIWGPEIVAAGLAAGSASNEEKRYERDKTVMEQEF